MAREHRASCSPRSTWTRRSARVCRLRAATASPSPTPGPTPITARSTPAWKGPWSSSRHRLRDDGAGDGAPATDAALTGVPRQNRHRARSSAGEARRESPMDQTPQPLIANTRARIGRSSHPRAVIGRRDLIKLSAGAGVAAVGVAGRGLILPWVPTSRAAAGEPLVEPEVRASRDGVLDTALTCSVMSVPVAGGTAIMRVYEGTLPGPTLRIRPGDTLRINLVNNLEALPAGLPADSPFLCSALGGPAHAAGGEHA